MFRKILKLNLIIIFLTNICNSEIVKSIEIEGNKRISKQTIILFSELETGENLTEEDINNSIKKLYETNFFKEVSTTFNNNILKLIVTENPIIQSIEISGVKKKSYSEAIFDQLSMKEKSSYIENFVNKDLKRIRNFLKVSGFYFSKVEADIKENDNNTIDLIYNVELGEKALIEKIKFNGDKVYKDKKLKNIIVSEESKFWKFLSSKKFLNKKRIDLDARLLKNFYLNKGYYNVKIENFSANLAIKNKFDLVFNINAGNKFFFNNFELIIPSDYNKDHFNEIFKKFEKLKNESYSLNNVRDILDEIDEIALLKQYEFINASIEENIVSDNKIDFKFVISETKKIYVNRINIIGNDITNEQVVRDMLIVDEGDPFNKLLHNKSINNIRSSNLFAKVDYELLESEDNLNKSINISVEEKPTGEISAGAGYGTSGKSITLGLKENNFRGDGVALRSNFTVSDNRVSGGLNFTIPNYKYSDKSLSTGLSRTVEDNLDRAGYKKKLNIANFGTSFEQREDLYFSPSFSLKFETLETSSTASTLLKKQEGDYYDLVFNYGLYYDKRNQTFSPTDGYSSNFKQELPLYSNNYSIKNSYDYKVYNQFADDWIGSASFFIKTVNSLGSEDVRVSERIVLPARKLRGFASGKIGPKDKNEFIGGNYASSLNFGLSLPTLLPELENFDFNLFVDAANVWGIDYDSKLDDSGSIRSSTGLSVNVLTPIGPLNFAWALPITKSSTDETENFRFDIGTTF